MPTERGVTALGSASWALAALFTLGLGCPAARAEEPAPHAEKATLAVVPCETSLEVRAGRQADLETIDDTLVRFFVKANKFDVVERSRIEAVVNEHQFATSSFGDPSNAARLGKLLGAQYLVLSRVRQLTVRAATDDIPYVEERRCGAAARLGIELRVVRTETGKIVAFEAGDSGRVGDRGDACGVAAKDAVTNAVNRVAEALVGKVIDAVYPIKAVHVAGREVTLNRGEGGNLIMGGTLDCFTQGEGILDPDTGETLGYEETAVGTLTVTQIMPKFSRAEAAEGVTIPTQAVCRVVRHEPPSAGKPIPPRPKVNF